MKYERFEDLPVWKAAQDLAVRGYRLTRHRLFSQPGDLLDQLRRASLSVSNNIAEGFERGSTAELLAFLYIARGSAGEARSMLRFCLRLLDAPDTGLPESEIPHLKSEISDLTSQISDLISLAESCSRQIRAWAENLQNSDIKGPRRLNEHTRQVYDDRRRSDEFRKKIEAGFREAHPELFGDAQ